MNIVVVVFDTLRQDHVGAYGNPWIVTPHLDAFAQDSVLFTRAYPESLPTLLFRRALHTGLRTYPFHGHREYKGEFPGVAPGWGPIPEEQDTLAEILGPSGYRCALITDTYHQFKPSKNFHRGFHEWIWVRGQELDRYRSGPAVSSERVQSHMNVPIGDHSGLAKFLGGYLRNNNERLHESDYYPAQVFSEASRWLWDNQDAERFFLVVDSFDPHEPWDPPVWYRKLYDPDDDVADIIQSPYCPWQETLTPRELKRVQANYAGEVTLVDRWFGQFMETLKLTGRMEDTVVVAMSDHGHNLGFDPGDKGMVSKQGHPMTHAVADLVLMMRHPSGEGAGSKCDQLVYNHDVVATLLVSGRAGAAEPHRRQGLLDGSGACRADLPRLRDDCLGPACDCHHRRVVVQRKCLGRGQALVCRSRRSRPGAQSGRRASGRLRGPAASGYRGCRRGDSRGIRKLP